MTPSIQRIDDRVIFDSRASLRADEMPGEVFCTDTHASCARNESHLRSDHCGSSAARDRDRTRTRDGQEVTEMKRVLFPLLACLLIGAPAAAQSDRGRLIGTIYDASGAVVPNASVSVVNQSTGAERNVSSDEKGNYRFEDLLPAAYLMAGTSHGVGQATMSVVLGAGQERTVHFRLRPEGVAESVSVTAESPLVDTSSAHLGASVSNREVNNLPLNGRQVAQLYLLVPGSTSTGSGTFNDMRFAGRANEQNVIRYDGIQAGSIIDANPGDINGSGGGAASFRLSQSLENIQEFHVESSNYNAEFGRGTGGQVTIITKSGSNAFHGTAFENVRNNRFD